MGKALGKASGRTSGKRGIAGWIVGAGLAGAVLTAGAARAEPPIRGPQDAACRNEARARVFSTPNPRGLEPEAIGRHIYHACMRRAKGRRR